MIKRYNQFINKINEADEVQAPVQPDVKPETAPAPTTTPDRRRERYTVPTPSVNPDPLASGSGEEGVEDNLEYLQDTLEGSQLMNNILKYQGHEITLPSETGEFEVDGVRNIKQEGSKLVPTSSAEDVIEYLNNPEAQAQAQAKQERRLQAQAQRAQAQVQAQRESLEFSQDEEMYDLDDEEILSDENTPDNEKTQFETQTGKDPEAEALAGEHVDVEKTGRHNESKSYRNRFRMKF